MYLHQTPLFFHAGIDTSSITIKEYPADYTIELEGSTSTYIGIVLEGQVVIQTYTVQGTKILISTLSEGMEFGDVLIFGSSYHTYPGNIVTKGKAKIAILPNPFVEELLHTNPTFRRNFLRTLSDKVYQGTMTSKLLSQDTLRDKILFYLTRQQSLQNSNVITLDMSKEELAQMLHVKRPSLSRELSNMKQEGLIDYDRKTITIKQTKS